MLKRSLSVVLVVALFAAGTACSKTGDKVAEETSESSAQTSAAVTETEETTAVLTSETTEEISEETTYEATEKSEETYPEKQSEGRFVLPNTDILFTMPDGYTVTERIPGLEDVKSASSVVLIENKTIFSASYDTDEEDYRACGMGILYWQKGDISEFDSAELIENGMGNQAERYDQMGIDYERYTEDISINDYTYTAEIMVTVPPEGEPSVAAIYLFLGDEDDIYLAFLMSPAENGIEEFLNAFTGV